MPLVVGVYNCEHAEVGSQQLNDGANLRYAGRVAHYSRDRSGASRMDRGSTHSNQRDEDSELKPAHHPC